jgi:hypothetical protein
MKLKIEKLDYNNFDEKKFIKEYFEKEKPVIIKNINKYNNLDPFKIKKHFGLPENKELGWFDSSLEYAKKVNIISPKFISTIFERKDISHREKPMRIFMQPGKHITLAHYDGNSLNGFNLQIKGKKKWILVSPNTPLPMGPFLYACLYKENQEINFNSHNGYEFETHPGEMLFLPRYWIHKVYSLDEINLNWVCTPKNPNIHSKLGKREVEILKLRTKIPFTNKFFHENFNEYGGEGKSLVKLYTKEVGFTRVISRIIKEILILPRTLLLARNVKSQGEKFKDNNFNIIK